MTFILIKLDSISCSSVQPITTSRVWKLWHSQCRTSSKLWPPGPWDEYWIPPEQQWIQVLSTDPSDQICSLNSGFRKSPHGQAEGWRTERIFQDFSTRPPDLYKWSFIRLHSSAGLKAATILWKPLKAQESECASGPNQDHDLLIDHKPHFQATHKGKTWLVSVYLVFHFCSFFFLN